MNKKLKQTRYII